MKTIRAGHYIHSFSASLAGEGRGPRPTKVVEGPVGFGTR